MKEQIIRWLNANTNAAVAGRVVKTTDEVAAGNNISRGVAFVILTALVSENYAFNYGHTTDNRQVSTWSTTVSTP